MQVDEISLTDPGQDGPPWLWVGCPPEQADQIRQKCARTLLGLQRRFCLSGDEIHALTVQTHCQLYRISLPPWAEVVIGRLGWSAVMAKGAIRGRRIRQVHWIRYAAVNDHLRLQREKGAKRPNKRLAFREMSKALRGQLGRGSWQSIGASYDKVVGAIRRGEVDRFSLGVLDNRYRALPAEYPGKDAQGSVVVVKRRPY
jgi:hypothetical protein